MNAGDTSKKLNRVLDVQTKISDGLRAWERESKEKLSGKEARAIEKLFEKLDDNVEQVGKLIEKVIKLNSRVDKARADQVVLDRDLAKLSAQEPTWAKVGEVLIETAANVGFLVPPTSTGPMPMRSPRRPRRSSTGSETSRARSTARRAWSKRPKA